MVAKKTKICPSCQQLFRAGDNARTCSARCRKRLQRAKLAAEREQKSALKIAGAALGSVKSSLEPSFATEGGFIGDSISGGNIVYSPVPPVINALPSSVPPATSGTVHPEAVVLENDLAEMPVQPDPEPISTVSTSDSVEVARNHYSLNRPFRRHVIQAISVLLLLIIAGAIFSLFNSRANQANNDKQSKLLRQLASSVNSNLIKTSPTDVSLNFNTDTYITGGKKLSVSGPVAFRNNTDSTQAFLIQNAGGDNLLTVDSSNGRVGIGQAPTGTAALQVNGDISANGSLLSPSGSYSLGQAGLSLGGNLVCTPNGCLSSSATSNIDTKNLAYLNLDQTFSGNNTFTGSAQFKSISTAAFQIQNSSGTDNLFYADTNNNRIGIGTIPSASGATLQVAGSVNVSTGAYQVGGTSGASFTCPANEVLQQAIISGGIVTGGSCVAIAGGTTPTIQQVYDASSPANIVLSTAGGGLEVQDAATPLGVNLFEVDNNGGGTKYFAVNSSGIAINGNVNTTGQYQVSGTQISSANLSNNANLAKLDGTQTFSAANTFSNASNNFTGNGSGLTNVNAVTLQGNNSAYYTNATNISTGTLADGRLSSNVALLNANQTFSGQVQFALGSGPVKIQDAASPLGTDLFEVTDSTGATKYFTVDASGAYINGVAICTTAGNCTGVGGGVTSTGGTTNQLAKFTAGHGIGNSIISDDGSTVIVAGDLAAGNINQNGNQVCDTSGNCVGSGGTGAAIGGSGTTNKVALFTGTGTIGNSILSQSGTTVGAAGSINITGTYQLNGSQISSADLSNDNNLAKLNATQTFSAANTFSNASNSFTGNGSGLTNVNAITLQGNNSAYYTNATNISTGTLADGRLSSNVALLNADQTFSGNNTLTGTLLAKNTTDSTTAFAIQNTSSNAIFTADTVGNQVVLGKANTLDGKLVFKSAGGSGSTTLSLANPGSSDFTLTLPAETGTICTTAVVCAGYSSGGGSGYVQLQGSTPGTQQSGNFNIDGTGRAGAFVQNGNPVCDASGNCVGTGGSGGVGGSGTANTIALFTGSGYTIGNSLLSQTGSTVTVSGTLNATTLQQAGSSVLLQSTAFSGDISGSYNSLSLAKIAGTTLTVSSLGSGNFLQYNGTAWVNQSISGDITINTSGAATIGVGKVTSSNIADGTITNTDISGTAAIADSKLATISTAGKVADSALSSNVALLNRNSQTFTGNNQVFKNATNSGSGLQIQNATGDTLLSVDTATGYVINNGITTPGNELENPGFEASVGSVPIGNVVTADGWHSTNGNFSINNDSANAHSGNNVLVGTPNSITHEATSKYYTVTPGETVYFQVYVKTAAGTDGSGGFILDFSDKDKTNDNYSNQKIVSASSIGTSYSLLTISATVPATMNYVFPDLTVRNNSTTGSWYFDDAYLVRSSQIAPITLQNSVDSTNAFQIQNATGGSVLNADTTNKIVTIANEVVSASGSLTLTGGNTASRPASPTKGMLYFDTSTNNLISYNGTKWVSAPKSNTEIVAASNSTQAEQDAADFVAGATNSETAINSALSALPAGGGSVYLMEGTYTLGSPINVPDNTTLEGAGSATILTVPNAQNGIYYFVVNSDTSTGNNVTIQNLLIDGNKANQTSGQMGGIYLSGLSKGRVSNVTVQNLYGGYGIYMTSTSNSKITGNNINDNNGPGISLQSGDGNTITDNNANNDIGDGIEIRSSQNIISGNTTNDTNGYGIYLNSSANGNTLSDDIATGNAASGVNIAGANNTLSNSTATSPTSPAITIQGPSNTVIGNTASSGNSPGIYLNYASKSTVSGNNIYDSGGSTTNNGIYLDSSSTLNSITNNDITDTSCSTTCRAISIGDTSSTGNYLSSNYFQGDGTHAATIYGANTSGTVYSNQPLTSNGDADFRNGTDSTTAFQIQDSGGTALLSADTSGKLVNISSSGALTFDGGTANESIYNSSGTLIVGNYAGNIQVQTNSFQVQNTNDYKVNFGLNATGQAVFQNSADSTTAFQIQNASGSSLINVDSSNSNITLLGNDSGALGAFSTNANPLPTSLYGHTSVTANGYVYVIGGEHSGSSVATVYYAKLNADGSTSAWTTSSNPLPAGLYNHTSVTVGGYVYAIGGYDGSAQQKKVYYAKLNADGSTSAWTTSSNPLPVITESPSAATANDYVYVMGGDSGGSTDTVYYAKLNADGSTSAWTTSSNPLPAAGGVEASAAVTANGYVYVMGGFNGSYQSAVYYAKLNADGSTSAWTTATGTPLPQSLRQPSAVTSNGYVYVMGGFNGSYQSTVYFSKLNSATGAPSSWSTNTSNPLPSTTYGQTSVIANGYVYSLGGYNGAYLTGVYYASTARLQIGASIDLVGLQGGTLSDPGNQSSGSTGGSITAGNITAVGDLQVRGQGSFAQGLSAGGNLTVGGSVLFQNSTDSTGALQVQNAAGASVMNVDTSDGFVGIGSGAGAPAYTLDVRANNDPQFTQVTARIGSTSAYGQGVGGGLAFSGLVDGIGTDRVLAGIQGAKENSTATNSNGELNFLTRTDGQSTLNVQATIGSNGATLFKNSANSTTAFQIQSASGVATLLNVDTTNSVITFAGTSSTFVSLTLTNAHFKSTQTTAPTIGTPTNCGASPVAAVTASSTDSAGSFTITAGGTGTVTSCDTVFSFNKAYGAAPKSIMVIGKGNYSSATRDIYVSASSASTFTVSFGQAGANSTAYSFYYWVVE